MKFEKLQARYVVPEMKRKFSLGSVDGLPRDIGPERDMIILEGTTSKGAKAWSTIDTVRLPVYGAESTIESWALVKELGKSFVGKEFTSPREAVRALGYLVDHHILKAGFANLFLDAQALEENVPLHTLVGGSKKNVEVGLSVSRDQSLEEIADRVIEGRFKRIKIKVSPSSEDYRKVAEIREKFPDLQLMIDANSSFDFSNPAHVALLIDYGNLDLLMIEQPLGHNDISDHIALQRLYNSQGIPGRVCLDESICTMDDLEKAVKGGIPIINIKITRVGGMDIARAMIDYCQAHGVDTWVGGMTELTTPGKAHALAVASHPGVTLPSDISGSEAYFKEENDPYVVPMVRDENGAYIAVPTTPGRGWEIDEKRMDAITRSKVEFSVSKNKS